MLAGRLTGVQRWPGPCLYGNPMSLLDGLLARAGYVKLSRYGLGLAPDGRIVPLAPMSAAPVAQALVPAQPTWATAPAATPTAADWHRAAPVRTPAPATPSATDWHRAAPLPTPAPDEPMGPRKLPAVIIDDGPEEGDDDADDDADDDQGGDEEEWLRQVAAAKARIAAEEAQASPRVAKPAAPPSPSRTARAGTDPARDALAARLPPPARAASSSGQPARPPAPPSPRSVSPSSPTIAVSSRPPGVPTS
ncbi:MAG TPA: hypothetical protein VHE35_05065, partial [Kofleriaceae bacterium]|nr:hypothetical protein [Kofleriaceae bacterium]